MGGSAAESELIDRDILGYLQRHEAKELLRFVIVGSVDDGKSTLIGRLLYDISAVYEDQLSAVRRATTMEGETVDFSLFTDGLAAEREQGITIDVAYRYFATERRKFIVADTPGHVQYTRNMVTGASTADVGVILIDARLGVLQQSRRHAYIASLLGIPHLVVCVNKMDLRGYAQETFETIRAEFRAFVDGLAFADVTFVPVSALRGENVVQGSPHMPWYDGPTVLGFLEEVPIAEDRNLADLRYPVQYVLRPNLDYRGFCGQVASGVVRKGDEVLVLPSGKRSRVRAIDSADGERGEAFAPESVTLRLEDEIDISRGDMIVHPHNRPRVARSFEAHVVWMHEQPLDARRSYWLKHTSRMVRMQVDRPCAAGWTWRRSPRSARRRRWGSTTSGASPSPAISRSMSTRLRAQPRHRLVRHRRRAQQQHGRRRHDPRRRGARRRRARRRARRACAPPATPRGARK